MPKKAKKNETKIVKGPKAKSSQVQAHTQKKRARVIGGGTDLKYKATSKVESGVANGNHFDY